MEIKEFLQNAYTPYHAVELVKNALDENGFKELDEADKFEIKRGGKYYVINGGTSLAAFTVGDVTEETCRYKISASHTDSPAFKVKYGGEVLSSGYITLETEGYGGAINYSWFDRPLKLAGRVMYRDGGKVASKLFVSEQNLVIPSVAVHMNRDVNKNFSVNVQVDIKPLFALGDKKGKLGEITGDSLDYDIYAVCDEAPFISGASGEFLSAPRIDNLTSVYASIEALIGAKPVSGINVAVLFDSEEVGSSTAEGAASTFLERVLRRVNGALGFTEEVYYRSLARSFLLSVDNAHAVHPNHQELSSPEHKALLGGGVTIKHHGNRNYITDGYSSAVIKAIFSDLGVKYQDFYMRSDMPCGRTLGALLLGGVSVKGADIGIAQLAMHSAVETIALSDVSEMKRGISAYYNAD